MLTYPFQDVKVCIYQNEREVKRMRTIAGLRADEKLTQEDLANELVYQPKRSRIGNETKLT